MSAAFENYINQMEQLSDNLDGTLKGGYSLVTNAGLDGVPPKNTGGGEWVSNEKGKCQSNSSCDGGTNPGTSGKSGCDNTKCEGSSNTNCDNRTCITRYGSAGDRVQSYVKGASSI